MEDSNSKIMFYNWEDIKKMVEMEDEVVRCRVCGVKKKVTKDLGVTLDKDVICLECYEWMLKEVSKGIENEAWVIAESGKPLSMCNQKLLYKQAASSYFQD